MTRFTPQKRVARRLVSRAPREDLAPHPALPGDTRLWAALVQASGGVWGGCVYDADAIVEQLARGAIKMDQHPLQSATYHYRKGDPLKLYRAAHGIFGEELETTGKGGAEQVPVRGDIALTWFFHAERDIAIPRRMIGGDTVQSDSLLFKPSAKKSTQRAERVGESSTGSHRRTKCSRIRVRSHGTQYSQSCKIRDRQCRS